MTAIPLHYFVLMCMLQVIIATIQRMHKEKGLDVHGLLVSSKVRVEGGRLLPLQQSYKEYITLNQHEP